MVGNCRYTINYIINFLCWWPNCTERVVKSQPLCLGGVVVSVDVNGFGENVSPQ